jgi:hypothetical protein
VEKETCEHGGRNKSTPSRGCAGKRAAGPSMDASKGKERMELPVVDYEMSIRCKGLSMMSINIFQSSGSNSLCTNWTRYRPEQEKTPN